MTKTEQMILDTIENKGRYVGQAGTCQRIRGTKQYSYGTRITKAINSLEAKGLIKVDRDTVKYQGYTGKTNRDTTFIATKA